jgi:hypothetical protein
MIVLRVVGGLLCAVALVAVMADLSLWISSGAWHSATVADHWQRINPHTLNLAQAVIERYVSAWLWDFVIRIILGWPTWAVLGVPGIILLALPRRRTRRRRRR